MRNRIDRREFIKRSSSAVLGAGVAFGSGLRLGSQETQTATIVEVKHPEVLQSGRILDEEVVRQMVREGIRKLNGSDDPWARFIGPEDRIGLKINTLGRPLLFTHHELIRGVVSELKEFGVKENNIIVWDRFEKHMADCEFEFNTTGTGVRCYGTISTDQLISDRIDKDLAYSSKNDDPEKREEGGTDSYFSRIFTQECDKIINMPILKDHGLCGVTLSLKNLAYGLCENNARFHGSEHIGPFIADFCAFPEVRKKVVLHILDGLEACYERGPRPRNLRSLFSPRSIWMSSDPVALDAVGLNIIQNERKSRALRTFAEENRPMDHIALAGKKGIGVSDLDRIHIEKIELS
ncbi:MAG: DUF362 domain-containing protein [Candidatus Aminicenantes bacterium]